MTLYEYESESPFESSSIALNLHKGTYLFQLWGAEACSGTGESGKGAYVEGVISFTNDQVLYLFIGAQGQEDETKDSFNGGGQGDYGGGGATDIRIINDTWDNFESLKSRIIVAAGGGAGDNYKDGGAAGAEKGFGCDESSQGGTQTGPGTGYCDGSFGKGGSYKYTGRDRNGGGGGGYYGGACGTSDNKYGGGGGSSFISGDSKCNAILQSSSSPSSMKHSGQSIHYSGLFFRKTKMIDGKNAMTSPYGKKENGHHGNGAAKITLLFYICHCSIYAFPSLPLAPFHLIFCMIY